MRLLESSIRRKIQRGTGSKVDIQIIRNSLQGECRILRYHNITILIAQTAIKGDVARSIYSDALSVRVSIHIAFVNTDDHVILPVAVLREILCRYSITGSGVAKGCKCRLGGLGVAERACLRPLWLVCTRSQTRGRRNASPVKSPRVTGVNRPKLLLKDLLIGLLLLLNNRRVVKIF